MSLGAHNFMRLWRLQRQMTPTNPSNIPSGRNGTEILSSHLFEDGFIYFG